MSLSRSPSPRPGGGWDTPGLTSDRTSSLRSYRANGSSSGNHSVTWESAKAKRDGINGTFSSQFNRHYRRISNSLPRFNLGGEKSYAEKEKLGRGRWTIREGGKLATARSVLIRVAKKLRLRGFIILALLLAYFLFYMTRECSISAPYFLLLIRFSITFMVAPIEASGRREKVCDHLGCKSRWWCDGVERS